MRPSRIALAAAAVVSVALVTPTSASATRSIYHDPSPTAVASYIAHNANQPYMGWSSWSMQSSHYPGLNTQGDYSWLTEQHVLEQATAMAKTLKPHGYTYVNIDAGWWRQWDWTPEYDAYGRPAIDTARFPHGIAYVANQVHREGLKLGIYMPVGLEKGAYDNGDFPIYGAPGCSTHDIVYPDLRTTNGWDSSYKMDFSNPCSQAYLDSIAQEFAGWGVDFLKLDGVGPGSFKSPAPNYDNRVDVQGWATALAGTHRKIVFQLSWSLDHSAVADWQKWSNSWRIDTDVECYCNTLVQWNHSVKQRFTDVLPWLSDAGRGGWNNLDSLDVGNGAMDGITEAERQTYMTFWSIEAAPLYTGDDVTSLDAYGRSLLTNDEVIAIDQAGIVAHPVSTATPQQVWWSRNRDGSYTVALFNLDSSPASVTAQLSDLGVGGSVSVRDLWSHKSLGTASGSITAQLPVHGSALYRVTPRNH